MASMLKILMFTLVLGIEFSAIGAGAAWAQMYSDDTLQRKLENIRTNLVATVEIEIPQLLDQPDRLKLRSFKADLPLRGRSPLDLYSDGNRIVIPMQTLQFIDDLATLKSWLDKHECDAALLFPNYLSQFGKEKRPKPPLVAFGLDRKELLSDRYVNDLSLKYYNSTVWFLIAHEIGHVAQGHQSVPGPASIKQEQSADALAIKVLRRKKLNPAGIYLYFLATSFNETLNGPRAHPMSGERIREVASELRKNPRDFVALISTTPSRDAELVLQIAGSIGRVAELLNDVQARRKKIEADRGASKLASIDAQVFPKVDFTQACPRGRRR